MQNNGEVKQEKTIITSLSKNDFINQLQENKGALIIKFGAEWCVPCKKIDNLVKTLISKLSDNVTCAILDVDENFEIYAFFKSKKMVSGIPTIIAFKKYNITAIPDDVIVGADENQINIFFEKYMLL
jgi:thioredoxin-like negative regulator of GroEL